jgi:sulfotransferase family protein
LPETASAVAARPRVEISRVAAAAVDGALAGFNLQHPVQGSSEPGYSFPLAGYAVPAHAAPAEIHLHGAQRRLPRVPVSIGRPDVAALHPDVSWAGTAGFAARLSTVHLPRRFELAPSLVLEDGTDIALGTIEGERPALPVYEHAAHRPLLVTTLGRSGSTWLTWILGQHAQIADYRSFEYESKVAAYFAEAVRALSSPASSYQAIRGDIDNSGWWLGREPRWSLRWYSSHDSIDKWLATEYVEDLIGFFAGRIDAVYRRLAEALGKPDTTYVVEKLPPIFFAQRMLAEIFPGTREIFLVRDFRDVACSIFAFGEKRGKEWYWERPWADDEQVIREFVRDEVDELLESWAERGEEALLLRYEDLVLRPEQALGEVFSELGVDSRPETVARVLADAARLDGQIWDVHSTSPTPARSIGRWRQELTPALQRACEEALGEGLQTFGYA